jgi:hypothetical protein
VRKRRRNDLSRRALAFYNAILAPLLDEPVFVGGCTTGDFVTDPAAGRIPPAGTLRSCADSGIAEGANDDPPSPRLRDLRRYGEGFRRDISP